MSPGNKRWALGLAMLATAVAAWNAPAPEADAVKLRAGAPQTKPQGSGVAVARPAGTASAGSPSATSASDASVLSIRPRRRDEGIDARLFLSTQWTKPNRKVEVVAFEPTLSAPLPVQPPPLPFVVLGRYEDAGQTAVFLQHNEQNLVVRVGDTIAGHYKVERLEGSTLSLRYLPLDQTQSLEVGASQ